MLPSSRRLAAVLVAVLALLPALPAGAQQSGADTGAVQGEVTSASCRAVTGATVAIAETSTVTSSSGAYELGGIEPGTRELVVGAPSPRFETRTVEVPVEAGEVTTADVVLPYATATVTRVAGPTRTDTAVAASRRAYSDGADAVVLASSGAFPDALAAAPLAASLGGPLLLVDARTGPAVLGEIRRLGPDEVVIVGAVSAVTAVVQAELLADEIPVRRIAGEDRFDTAALVAREVGLPPSGEVALATGASFADALSFAPLAAAGRIPVLLTGRDELPSDTAAALAELAPETTTVLGGTAVISDAVADRLPGADRIGGATRFQTSIAIAERALERGLASPEIVSVATGATFADALAAGPVAALDGGPLVLVDGVDASNADAQDAFAFLADHLDVLDEVVVYGGRVAITEDVASLLGNPAVVAEGSDCPTPAKPSRSPEPSATPMPSATPEPTIRPSEGSDG